MNNKTTFTDITGQVWSVAITVEAAERVRLECKDSDGNSLDLFAMAEQGDFRKITANYKSLLQLVFVICLDDILRSFDVSSYDATNVNIYEAYPQQRALSIKQKAAKWFGSRLDGKAVSEAVDALKVSLVNFIPDRELAVRTQEIITAQEAYIKAKLDQATKYQLDSLEKPLES